MSDNESFVSVDNNSEDVERGGEGKEKGKGEQKREQKREQKGEQKGEQKREQKGEQKEYNVKNFSSPKCLDTFLDFDINYMGEEEKCNYIGPSVCPREDYITIKNEKIQFFKNEHMENVNHILLNKTKEEVDTFYKLKKELFNIAYRNQIEKMTKNKNNGKEVEKGKENENENERVKEKEKTGENEKEKEKDKDKGPKENENIKRESENNELFKSLKSYDLLNNDILGVTLGNKIEDTYNDIKSGVNWIGNFFSNADHSDEKKRLSVFYSDLYFFNDISIIRYLETYKFNLLKTLNKIVKCILWRQVTIAHFNEEMDRRVKKEEQNEEQKKQKEIEEEKEQVKMNQAENKCNVRSVYINPKHIKDSIIKTSIFRCGFDTKTRPILYIKIQEKLDIEENYLFLNLVYHVDMCMNSVNYNKCYDKEKKEIYWNDNKFDETALQLVVVVDCLKFDLNNMISIECIKKIITCFNEFYTDVLYRIYIINVPSFFKKVWSLFNMFIDNYTLKKIIIINKNNINLMYEHISSKMMKHFDRTDENKIDNQLFFPSTTLYYKYDEQQYNVLMTHVNTWVNKMISVNHG